MWRYRVLTGEMTDGQQTFHGYSGVFGVAQNNTAYCMTPDVGPIPAGLYSMGTAYSDPVRGPEVIPLQPHPDNQMYGRSGFLIHGDNIHAPGHASTGCIILGPAARDALAKSANKTLWVSP